LKTEQALITIQTCSGSGFRRYHLANCENIAGIYMGTRLWKQATKITALLLQHKLSVPRSINIIFATIQAMVAANSIFKHTFF
jgi:hypothetical protein